MRIKNPITDNFSYTKKIKLVVPAGMAKMGPPIGPILGQAGININEFCKLFNDNSSSLIKGVPLAIDLFVGENKKFAYVINPPSINFLIKSYFNRLGFISKKEIYKISLIKSLKFNQKTIPICSIYKATLGTLNSMKIKIKDE